VIIERKISPLMLGSVQRMTIYDRANDGFRYDLKKQEIKHNSSWFVEAISTYKELLLIAFRKRSEPR